MMEIQKVSPSDKDARLLIQQLNAALYEITGNDGTGSFNDSDVMEPESGFFVGYLENEPICCGSFRRLSENTAEMKRVYSRRNHVGAAHQMVQMLEQQALNNGFSKMVLETRMVNTKAVSFYISCGYKECPNYGKYADRDNAICFEKNLYR